MYADELLSRGDRLGELIALELALGPSPSRGALESFQGLARRVCHSSRRLEVGWCLGHARTLAVRHEYPPQMVAQPIAWLPAGALAVARDFLRSPQGQTVERFSAHLPRQTVESDPWWRRVLDALPPSCEVLALGLPESVDLAAARTLLDALPPFVRTLLLWRPRPGHQDAWPSLFVDDRLDWVDLTWWTPTQAGLESLFRALEGTSHVRVRLSALRGPVPPALEPRLRLGRAGLVADDGWACVLPRWPLRLLQRHHGIVSVHAQLHRLLAERYDLDHPEPGRLAASFKQGNALVRHGSGEWTARSSYSLPLDKNGVALCAGALPVPLVDGDTVRVGQDPTRWRFVSSSVDDAFRRASSRIEPPSQSPQRFDQVG